MDGWNADSHLDAALRELNALQVNSFGSAETCR